jgi:NADPH:quinone reductase-like Zn-dependent oxidoreductase
MALMKAIQIHRYGAPDVFISEEVERPVPGVGEVLVRVRAVGINPVDTAMRAGYLAGLLGEPPFPLILGWDISGEVVELGTSVTEFAPGDEVYGLNRFPQLGKAYAEYVTAPVTDIGRKPHTLSHVEAAVLPLAGLAAWQALFVYAKVQAGERILIHAAAGGVGHLATQLARWKGAHVIGTASACNIDFVRGLGAETVIDYTSERFEEHVHDLDVAIDSMSGEIQERTIPLLKKGGRLVALLIGMNQELAKAHGVEAIGMLVSPNRMQLDEITRLVEDGQLKVHVEAVFPLQEVARAHELVAGHHVRGKVALEVA